MEGIKPGPDEVPRTVGRMRVPGPRLSEMELIYPEPLGSVRMDGVFPEAFAWHQAMARVRARPSGKNEGFRLKGRRGKVSREAARAMFLAGTFRRASDAPPPPGAAPGGGRRITVDDAATFGGVDGGPDPYSDDVVAPHDPLILTGGETGAAGEGISTADAHLFGGGGLSPDDSAGLLTCFEYGEASFCVPTAWLADYVANDRASSAEEAEDILWARFKSRHAPSSATIRERLQCWNVGTRHLVDGVRWSAFWADGGPIHYFEAFMAMAYRYAEYAVDVSSGTEYCTEMENFIRRAVAGGNPTNIDGKSCDVRFFFKSIDSRFVGTEGSNCDEHTAQDCGLGYDRVYSDAKCGSRFDNWTLEWAWEEGVVGPRWLAHVRVRGSNDYPEDSCDFAAKTGSAYFYVAMLPSRVAFNGFLADYLMTWARVALDYGMETGSDSYLEQADLIARFVLRRALNEATTLVHEMAHIRSANFESDAHCATGCCVRIVSYAFACAVRADLGLGQDDYKLAYSSDAVVEAVTYGCDDGTVAVSCEIESPGIPGQAFSFAAEPENCP